jgi:hypothetical protein
MRELFGNLRTLLSGKNYLVFSVVMLLIVGLPLSVVVLQHQQDLQQKATAATTFFFSPSSTAESPSRTSVNETVSLDVMVNPGTNAIANVRLELQYDPTKFGEISGTPVFTPNPATFPQITEQPTISPGRVLIGLSIGSDPTRAVTAITKIGTITLKVTDTISATSNISFGTNSTATSITTTGTTAGANVLSSTSPAVFTTQLAAATTSPITVSLSPLADTYVQSGSPTLTHGTSSTISVASGSDIKVAYLKFDLSSLTGKTIQSAKLHFKVSNGSAGTQTVKSVSDTAWSESGMTYTNKPALGSSIGSISSTSDNQIRDIDLTSFVSSQKGHMVSLGMDSTSTDTFGMNSKEASADKPVLLVMYTTLTSVTATKIPTSPSPTGISSVPSATKVPSPTVAVGGSCSAVATDTVLIIDRSSSMKDELPLAKTAAKLFVDQAAKNSQNKVGVVVFDTNSAVSISLTNNFAAVKTAIDAITLGSGTCTQCGIDKANAEIAANGRAGIKKVAVLLTDGRANHINGKSASSVDAENAAVLSVKSGTAAKGTSFFTIGLGNDVNTTFLQQLATITGGTYSFSPTADQLAAIYTSVSTIVGKGSITGTAFVDTNNNGIKEATEPLASGWIVSLKTNTGTPIGTNTTNASGGYSFSNLCDGITYIVTLTQKTGWTQTLPGNNGTYSVPITNGEAVENKDFGVSNGPNPTEQPLPIVHLTGTPTTLSVGGTVTLTWTSEGANSCLAGGVETGWTGTKAVSGSQPVGPLTIPETYIFTLTCTNAAGSASGTATITVLAPSPTVTSIPSPTITRLPTQPDAPTATNVPTLTLMPTMTTVPTGEQAPTTLTFSTFLHSIGGSGDNVNPNSSLSNKEPVHPQRPVKISVYNAANQLETTADGLMTYASESGNFVGTVTLGSSVTSGSHIVTVTTDSFLTNLFPGIQTITMGKPNTVPATSLVAGDVNHDNKLNILDYNTLLGCYTSDDQPQPKSCTTDQQRLADLNDEGAVNRYDYNLFLRELSVQSGFNL